MMIVRVSNSGGVVVVVVVGEVVTVGVVVVVDGVVGSGMTLTITVSLTELFAWS